MPNISCVSGLSILHCLLGFSNVSFYIKPHDIIVKRGRGKLIVEEQKTYYSFFLLSGMPGFPELVD